MNRKPSQYSQGDDQLHFTGKFVFLRHNLSFHGQEFLYYISILQFYFSIYEAVKWLTTSKGRDNEWRSWSAHSLHFKVPQIFPKFTTNS